MTKLYFRPFYIYNEKIRITGGLFVDKGSGSGWLKKTGSDPHHCTGVQDVLNYDHKLFKTVLHWKKFPNLKYDKITLYAKDLTENDNIFISC